MSFIDARPISSIYRHYSPPAWRPIAKLPKDEQGFVDFDNLKHPDKERDAATKGYVDTSLRIETSKHLKHEKDKWNCKTFALVSVGPPVNPSDAATKGYVDTCIQKEMKDQPSSPSGHLKHENGGWDFKSLPLVSVSELLKSSDAATKGYVDYLVDDCLSENRNAEWDCGSLPLINVGVPTNSTDAATKGFCTANFLGKSSSSFKTWDAKDKLLLNLKRPVGLKDAVNKACLDNNLATCLRMDAGNFNVGGMEIKNVKDPRSISDAATKGWVLGQLPEAVPFFICQGHHNNEVDVEFDTATSSNGQFGISQDKKKLIIPEEGIWEITLLEHMKENKTMTIEVNLTGVNLDIPGGDKFV